MIPGSGAGRGTSIQGAVYSKKWQEGGRGGGGGRCLSHVGPGDVECKCAKPSVFPSVDPHAAPPCHNLHSTQT